MKSLQSTGYCPFRTLNRRTGGLSPKWLLLIALTLGMSCPLRAELIVVAGEVMNDEGGVVLMVMPDETLEGGSGVGVLTIRMHNEQSPGIAIKASAAEAQVIGPVATLKIEIGQEKHWFRVERKRSILGAFLTSSR